MSLFGATFLVLLIFRLADASDHMSYWLVFAPLIIETLIDLVALRFIVGFFRSVWKRL